MSCLRRILAATRRDVSMGMEHLLKGGGCGRIAIDRCSLEDKPVSCWRCWRPVGRVSMGQPLSSLTRRFFPVFRPKNGAERRGIMANDPFGEKPSLKMVRENRLDIRYKMFRVRGGGGGGGGGGVNRSVFFLVLSCFEGK